jgi:EpsI family protein
MGTNIITGALVLSGCLVASSFALDRASKSERVPPRAPFSEFPLHLETEWQGQRTEDMDAKVLSVLGVDDYLSLSYRKSTGGTPVGLFVGYYESQRQGDTMHSPMNCLPGAGWLPTKTGRATVPIDSAVGHSTIATPAIEVNRFVLEKSGQSILVLYWYQGHGRVVASEYWGKIYTVLDALRTNRTDAALVRVIVPIAGTGREAEDKAEHLGVEFVRAMFPTLEHHLPA